MYCDHIERDGEGLFQRACENDGEGVVAKRNCDPYLRARRVGLKMRNTDYSQWAGREEVFNRERESDPDLPL